MQKEQNNRSSLYCVFVCRERSRQKNFQLIIITHDIQFVELIGRSDYVDDYYLVQKAMGYEARVALERLIFFSVPESHQQFASVQYPNFLTLTEHFCILNSTPV